MAKLFHLAQKTLGGRCASTGGQTAPLPTSTPKPDLKP